MKQAHHPIRIDTHRPCIMELEAEDCAPEGHWRINQGDYIPPAPRAIKVPRATTPLFLPLLGVLCIIAVALVSFFAWVNK